MTSQLILVHRPTKSISDSPTQSVANAHSFSRFESAEWFIWKTCLRQIAVGTEESFTAQHADLENDASYEIYRGDDIYRFLLETICGLHSPLMGETEVYGQFKLAATAQLENEGALAETPFGHQLRRQFRLLFEDAKRVRQAHLVDLGSQSYGSVLRREVSRLKNPREVHVIGAGHLVQEILPWIIKDGSRIHVHCRDIDKGRKSLEEHADKIEFHSLFETMVEKMDALIVAAPIESARLAEWLSSETKPRFIADLRAESETDPIIGFERVLDLAQVFGQIQSNQALLDARKDSALALIESIVNDRSRHVEYRPFGWEDVCA